MSRNLRNTSQSSTVIFYSGLILSVIIPVVLLNLPLFKQLSNLDMFGYGLGFISLIATLFFSLYASYTEKIRENQRLVLDGLKQINQSIQSNVSYAVSKEVLYEKMREMIINAEYKIDLSYLGELPPDSYRRSTSRELYIKALSDVVASKKVAVRRIVLLTDSNKAWIKSIVTDHTRNEYFSLAIIPKKPELPVVSVQVIDSSKAILINLNSSDTTLAPRDIVVESVEMTSVFEIYYNNIYSKCIEIVNNGRVNQENYKLFIGS